MNAEDLLKHYARISEAPDAIPKLRRFVLDLAVRGKLVEQDATDEPAAELLKQISAEKSRLVKGGEIGKQAPFSSVPVAERPFAIPTTWRWVPATYPTYGVSDLGKKIKTKDVLETGKHPVVDQGKVFIRGFCNDSSKVIKVQRPIIVFGDHTRETKLIDFDFVVGADGVKLLQPICLDERFYFLVLEWLPLDSRGYGRHFKMLKASVIPLPPLAEQHRIVAKVDELMVLCDRLEEARTARETVRDKLTAASLARLTASDTSDTEFQSHARFALQTLPALTTRPDQIKPLRQTILNLAVRGKLVAQEAGDEPASELLRLISNERKDLAENEGIKIPRKTRSFDDGETPFEIPENWIWGRLGDLVLHSDAGWSPQTLNHARVGAEWGVLKVSAVSWGNFDPEANKQVLPGTEPRLQAKVREGDFLISRANTAELVARAVLVEAEPENLMMSDKIVRLRMAEVSNKRFIWMVNNRPDYARAHYAENATGVSPSMKNVSRQAILDLPVPIPPLAEQHRIVVRVDALMAICDRLEASLTTADTTRQRLLTALLHEALNPAEQELEAAG
jgi:type I restriction enzyme S subunit